MYYALRKSISGDLQNIVFGSVDNLPAHEDGPLLFKQLTTYTSMATLNLTIISLNQISSLDPAKYDYNIPNINTHLGHLFVLASTHVQALTDAEKIQHTLMAYQKIKQPQVWA